MPSRHRREGAEAGAAAGDRGAVGWARGCSPVETYRNLIGVSKNDPNPATTPNTKNLAAGEASDYPNLATVPEPPTQALTTAELDKLTQSLIADRTNAKYTSEKLQAGFDQAAGPFRRRHHCLLRRRPRRRRRRLHPPQQPRGRRLPSRPGPHRAPRFRLAQQQRQGCARPARRPSPARWNRACSRRRFLRCRTPSRTSRRRRRRAS